MGFLAGFTANAENADEQAVVIFPVFPMPAEFSLSFATRTDQPRDKSLAVMVEYFKAVIFFSGT